MAVNLNHNTMTSFCLHKLPRTPKSDSSHVDRTVWEYYHMQMDSISMCSNSLFMSFVDAGSSLRWLSASTMTDNIILTPQVTQTSDPRSVGIPIWGYCRSMPLASISMCQNALFMSVMDDGSTLRWLSTLTTTQWHHFVSTSYPAEPPNLTQVMWIELFENTNITICRWTAYQCAQTLCLCL